MAKSLLVDPEEVTRRLQQRYTNQRRRWLTGNGQWPLSIPLGIPSEREAHERLPAVQTWQRLWHEWRGDGEIVWAERRWSRLGTQNLPESLVLQTPIQVARWAGDADRWELAQRRYALVRERWPCLEEIVATHFDVLADYPEEDFHRLLSILAWLENHPDSGLYLRQLPIEGVDTKWLSTRKSLVGSLFRVIRQETSSLNDFYVLTGIRREPVLTRMRVLDPDIRIRIGGLSDITVPVEDLTQIQLPFRCVFVVENLQTGLAFEDLPGAALFMGLGYAVDLFAGILWLSTVPCFYWGDLDTHGFSILNRLRHYVPHARSILMDEATLTDHRLLWGQEEKSAASDVLPLLTIEERKLYDDLCNHRFASRVRLEQERIPWEYAWNRIVTLTK